MQPCYQIHLASKNLCLLHHISPYHIINKITYAKNKEQKVKLLLQISVSNFRRNVIRRVHTDAGLNYVTDTLTSAWDAMRANFGVHPTAAAPHGWLATRRPYRFDPPIYYCYKQ